MTPRAGLRERWHGVRSLLWVLTVREFRSRYRQSRLELAWGLITPVVTLAIYGLFLTKLFGVDGGGAPYLSLVWSGMVVWMMFSTAVNTGVTSLTGNADLITKVYFPREALSLSVVGASLADLAIGGAVLVPLVAVQVGRIGPELVAILPIVLVVLVWTAAVTVFVATVAVFVRDAVHATRLVVQVGFFATPVMYSAADLPEELRLWETLNPLAVCISALRDVVLFQRWPGWALAWQGLAGLVLLVGAVLLTRATEDRMNDVL